MKVGLNSQPETGSFKIDILLNRINSVYSHSKAIT